jgi:hypothetical protein
MNKKVGWEGWIHSEVIIIILGFSEMLRRLSARNPRSPALVLLTVLMPTWSSSGFVDQQMPHVQARPSIAERVFSKFCGEFMISPETKKNEAPEPKVWVMWVSLVSQWSYLNILFQRNKSLCSSIIYCYLRSFFFDLLHYSCGICISVWFT